MGQGRLEGKVAIVTGCDSPIGIGYASALALSREGAAVAITGLGAAHEEGTSGKRPKSQLSDLAERIESEGGEVIHRPLDVCDVEAIDALVEDVAQRFGRIDILVNNAGTMRGTLMPFVEVSRESWEHVVQVNLLGAQRFCQQVIPVMAKGGGGSIINMSSGLGTGAVPNMSAYIATKFALIGLTKAIATEVGTQNIRCNALCPGAVDTEGSRAAGQASAELMGTSHEKEREMITQMIPLGRVGTCDDIAPAVVWLASEESRYVTGAPIMVTGGMAPGL